MSKYDGYDWIKVPRAKPSIYTHGKNHVTEEHHLQETEFLIEEVRKLAKDRDELKKKYADLAIKFSFQKARLIIAATAAEKVLDDFDANKRHELSQRAFRRTVDKTLRRAFAIFNKIELGDPKNEYAYCNVCGYQYPLDMMKEVPAIGYICKGNPDCEPKGRC